MNQSSTIPPEPYTVEPNKTLPNIVQLEAGSSSTDELPGAECDTAKRQQILDGARQIFLRDGFDGASMNDITRAAGVSKGTIYAYFRSKEVLFESLIREERRCQLETFVAPDWPDADIADILFSLGVRLVEKITRPDILAQLRIVIAAAVKFPNIGAAFFEAGPLAGKARLAAYFDRLHADGRLNIANSACAANQFVELCRSDLMMRGLLNLDSTFGRGDIEASVRAAVDLFMKAYGPGAAADPGKTA